jgi:DNA-binding response OmpR family regulator
VSSLLIVEDDPLISGFVDRGLRAAGFSTHVTDDGDYALHLALNDGFDLVVLDMGLRGMDGLDVLRELRRQGRRVPVLVLTGRPERDVVQCLEAGADDYMQKPFRIDELLARVRTRLREAGTREETVLTAAGVTLDLRSRKANVDGRDVELTAREFALLEALMRRPGQVMSRAQLLSSVWGYFHDPTTNLVNVYVHTLRGKLGPDVIETVRGFGYRVAAQGSRPTSPSGGVA